MPNTREALEALPGVGRKTANVILNTAFGQPTMAVDTHIFRVSNRTGIAKGKMSLRWSKTTAPCAKRISSRCSPLVDSSRPLHLHRAQTSLR
ncbi:hypothetical protein HORIV_30510 [Vreelandella olivaria]|uniref:HhH-GPD domain-containing protein n=1 Tax=Vreelandella olivaria TaxID=390919 RepID=A0ABM7GJ88_9GAMM|nr:hypothetical protein HORIV_30510 [Halomonas olivaria]